MKYFKLVALAMAVFMFTGMFSACRKDKDKDSQASGTQSKTSAAAAKTTPKSSGTAKSSTNVATSTNARTSTSDTHANVPLGTDTEKGIGKSGEDANDPEAAGNADGSGIINETYKIFDLKGREIKAVVWTDTMIPSPQPGNIGGPKMYDLMKEAETKFNCKFVFEVKANATILNNELQSAVMAGVYYTDLARITRSSACPVMEKNNILLPISDYIDFNQPVYQKYDQVNGVINPDKIYAFFN